MKMRCIVLEMGIAPFFVRSAYVRDMLTFMKLFDKNLSGIYNRFNKNQENSNGLPGLGRGIAELNKKQQWTVRGPGGFPDADAAGSAPRSWGLGGELRNLMEAT